MGHEPRNRRLAGRTDGQHRPGRPRRTDRRIPSSQRHAHAPQNGGRYDWP